MKYCFDASVLLDMWNDIYPKPTFPTLYEKINRISDKVIIIKPIYYEIEEEKELVYWLKKEAGFSFVSTEEQHEKLAFSLGDKYKIKSSSQKGVSRVDIKLISFAKIEKHTIVTSEAEQPQPPDKTYDYKIPLVCKKEGVGCIKFVEFLKQNNIAI